MAARLVGLLREQFAGVDGLGSRSKSVANVFKPNHPTQAVGTQEQRVAAAQFAIGQVDLHRIGGAQGLQDDVVVLEGLGFLFRQLPGLDELVHERLISRDKDELSVAQDVSARVADLRKEQMVIHECRRGDRRSHAAPTSIELRFLENPQPSGFDGTNETARETVSCERMPLFQPLDHSLVEDVDRKLAGNLACRRSSHAVTDCEQRSVRPQGAFAVALKQTSSLAGQVRHEEVVLVVFADLADIGTRESLDANFTLRWRLSPGRVPKARRDTGRFVLRHERTVSVVMRRGWYQSERAVVRRGSGPRAGGEPPREFAGTCRWMILGPPT